MHSTTNNSISQFSRHANAKLFLLIVIPLILYQFASNALFQDQIAAPNEAPPSTVWISRQLEHFAKKFNDASAWDAEFLVEDRRRRSEQVNGRQRALPFPHEAFPAPRYEIGDSVAGYPPYLGLNCRKLSLQAPLVGCETSINLERDPAAKTGNHAPKIEPVMCIVAMGPDDISVADQTSTSRNFPDYFFQGSFSNTQGSIDWVALRLAQNRSIGIVNGRVLDLALGNFIVVRQYSDGSVRILQLRDRLRSGALSDVHQTIKALLRAETCQRFLDGELQMTERTETQKQEIPAQLVVGSAGWTDEQLSEHANNYNDPNFWSKALLEMDVKNSSPPADIFQGLPFSKVAFPVPYYLYNDELYGGLQLGGIPLSPPFRAIGASINQPLAMEDIPAGKTYAEVVKTEPIFYIAAGGDAPLKEVNSGAISRSKPHFFFQGSFVSNNGSIDWLAFRMQDGTEIAVVNGRVLRLEFGNAIFVYQEEDGLVQIFQHPKRLQIDQREKVASAFTEKVNEPNIVAFLNQEVP